MHDFDSVPIPAQVDPASENLGPNHIPGLSQLSDVQGGRAKLNGDWRSQSDPGFTQEFMTPGFRALDSAMKCYWSGMRVPTKDSYRFMRVKIAGGDRSLMVWSDELKGGRIRLPVASLDRTGFEFNPNKYSPNTTHPMAIRYPSKRGDLAIKVFRPMPFLVNYTMAVWTERKRDMEFILYQVGTRFNGGLAEFRMFDGHLQGTVTLSLGNAQDASDKEAGYDQHANVRYEITMIAEAWLPLPERVVKTVLGRPSLLKERLGSVLATNSGYGWVE